MNKFLLLFLFLSYNMSSQEVLKNSFYSLNIPQNTSVKPFGATHEELANIDVYELKINDKPKYLLYLMSNKVNTDIDNIDLNNYQDFLSDLGLIKINEVKDFNNILRILFSYEDKASLKAVLYMSINGDVLNRFLFLLPNENSYLKFEKEINKMVADITYLKTNWN